MKEGVTGNGLTFLNGKRIAAYIVKRGRLFLFIFSIL